MPRKFLTSIDLAGNQLLNAALHNLASDPVTGVEGQVYYNTSTEQGRIYANGAWADLSGELIPHEHAAADITSGTLTIGQGGTGATTAGAALTALGAASATDYLDGTGINVGNWTAALSLGNKADRASPTFTGLPLAPTAAPGTNNTEIATTAFTVSEILTRVASLDVMIYRGVLDASSEPNYPAGNAGNTYIISVAGKVGGAAGIAVLPGDYLICNTDATVSGNQATVGSNWNLIKVSGSGSGDVTLVGVQTLTNKTLTSPVINTPMGIVQGDISGLVTALSDKLDSSTAATIYQPLDADLTAIASLITTGFGRDLLTQADAAAVRATIGAGSSTFDGVYSSLSGTPATFTPGSHTHGNITNAGAVGSTANLPLITGASGVVAAGSFGIAGSTFCEGNDGRLSNDRTPTAHTHAISNLTQSAATPGQVISWDGSTWAPAASGSGGNAQTANPLSQFAATTSAQLAGVISDETGTGALVFATSPAFVTPDLGNVTTGNLVNCTGYEVANLTGFEAAVTANTSVTANTAKVTNATHTGEVTGATSLTIAAGAVTLGKMANLAANSFIGNNTGSAATPVALSVANAKTLLAITQGDVSGLVTDLGNKIDTSAANLAYQALDSDLTSIAALTTTGFGRGLLTQADAAATRTTIGAGTSSFDGVYSSLSGTPATFAPSAHNHTAGEITSGTLVIAQGGTGLSTIGDPGKVLTSVGGLIVYRDPAGDLATATDAATVTFNLATSRRQIVTLAGNRTLALSNDADGMAFTLIIRQDATGTRTVTWWAGIKWSGGTAPVLTTVADKYDVFAFVRIVSGEYLGFLPSLNH